MARVFYGIGNESTGLLELEESARTPEGEAELAEIEERMSEKKYLTPLGVRCSVHNTHAKPDEPCWQCEHAVEKKPRASAWDGINACRSCHRFCHEIITTGFPCGKGMR